jgi:hypothetical protein
MGGRSSSAVCRRLRSGMLAHESRAARPSTTTVTFFATFPDPRTSDRSAPRRSGKMVEENSGKRIEERDRPVIPNGTGNSRRLRPTPVGRIPSPSVHPDLANKQADSESTLLLCRHALRLTSNSFPDSPSSASGFAGAHPGVKPPDCAGKWGVPRPFRREIYAATEAGLAKSRENATIFSDWDSIRRKNLVVLCTPMIMQHENPVWPTEHL